MRKYIIGFMVGAALTFAIQAGAATLLDSTVDAVISVEVDGENLGQAPVIDGVSYLPVRKFGNKAGYKVDFGEGKATLTNEETPVEAPTETMPPENNYTLESIELSIKVAVEQINFLKYAISSAESRGYAGDPEVLKMKESLTAKEAELEVWKKRKSELEAQP